MNRKVMATALRGTKSKGKVKNTRQLRAARPAAVHAARSAPHGLICPVNAKLAELLSSATPVRSNGGRR
jgi:hypothetical protein